MIIRNLFRKKAEERVALPGLTALAVGLMMVAITMEMIKNLPQHLLPVPVIKMKIAGLKKKRNIYMGVAYALLFIAVIVVFVVRPMFATPVALLALVFFAKSIMIDCEINRLNKRGNKVKFGG